MSQPVMMQPAPGGGYGTPEGGYVNYGATTPPQYPGPPGAPPGKKFGSVDVGSILLSLPITLKSIRRCSENKLKAFVLATGASVFFKQLALVRLDVSGNRVTTVCSWFSL